MKETDSGDYRIEADNGMAIASFSFSINVEVPPSSPSMPDILDVAPTGIQQYIFIFNQRFIHTQRCK